MYSESKMDEGLFFRVAMAPSVDPPLSKSTARARSLACSDLSRKYCCNIGITIGTNVETQQAMPGQGGSDGNALVRAVAPIQYDTAVAEHLRVTLTPSAAH